MADALTRHRVGAADTVTDVAHSKRILLSSGFDGLHGHRFRAIEALNRARLTPITDRYTDVRNPDASIARSLALVRLAAAYIGIIGWKYGPMPRSKTLNPDGLSMAELEYDEAVRLGIPIQMFVVGWHHPVGVGDNPEGPSSQAKLSAFRAKAVRDGVVTRFEDFEAFSAQIDQAVESLVRELAPDREAVEPNRAADRAAPRPPALAAHGATPASSIFVGRETELQLLSEWAAPGDPNPILVIEAIGGTGKSTLIWEWLHTRASTVRGDWAGEFWYSFYEDGSGTNDFCQQALTYMTGSVPAAFALSGPGALAEALLAELHRRPWLVVLDGVERLLTAYSRASSTAMLEDEVSGPDLDRQQRAAAARPGDEALLRALAAASPSKLVLSTRLTPSALVSRGGSVPGVRRLPLAGLKPADAEALLLANGIAGDTDRIRQYLEVNSEGNPLIVGAIAGLVNRYAVGPGDFDRWANDEGEQLRIHIGVNGLRELRARFLNAAIGSLTPESLQVLRYIALLRTCRVQTLIGLNPHPTDMLVAAGEGSPGMGITAEGWLRQTVGQFRDSGFVEVNGSTGRISLHPVIRALISSGMNKAEEQELRRKITIYFDSRRKPAAVAIDQDNEGEAGERHPDIFVSYAGPNEAVAKRVVAAIEAAGYTVAVQFRNPAGRNFVERMKRGLRAPRLVALLSPAYEASGYCQAEWNAAFTDDPDGTKGKLVGLLIEPTELNFLARAVIYANLIGLEGDAFDARVVEALRGAPNVRPLEGVPAPVRHGWTAEGRLAVENSALPQLGSRPPGDLAKQLATVRKLATILVTFTASAEFNHSREYSAQIRLYLDDVPVTDGDGNMYLADAAARTLREMFAAEAAILSTSFTARLKTFLECHIGLRAYYPEVADFYASVRDGVLTESLPLDAVHAVRSAIEAHTPSQFDPSVAEEIDAEVASAPAVGPEPDMDEGAHAEPLPQPPPDPIAVDRDQARDQLVARSLNGMWSVFLKGKDVVPNIDAWRRAYESLEPAIRPVIDYLRRSMGL